MGNKEHGECSKTIEKENISDRPLKKAKYVWQVKGKYHLKANLENTESGTVLSNKYNKKTENGCVSGHKDGQYKGKCIDKFLAQTESILDSDEEDYFTKNIDQSISDEIPVTLVTPSPKNSDYYLKQWQARQIARSYVDNTINSVLETWVSAPFDAEDFVDNCEHDGRVEDQGIMMAIQAHGLQSDDLNETSVDNKMGGPAVFSACSTSDECGGKGESGGDVVYPVDILNAAILVAIERKGLSSHANLI